MASHEARRGREAQPRAGTTPVRGGAAARRGLLHRGEWRAAERRLRGPLGQSNSATSTRGCASKTGQRAEKGTQLESITSCVPFSSPRPQGSSGSDRLGVLGGPRGRGSSGSGGPRGQTDLEFFPRGGPRGQTDLEFFPRVLRGPRGPAGGPRGQTDLEFFPRVLRGPRGPGVQESRGPGVQGSRSPGVQGSRGPGVQGSRGLGVRGVLGVRPI